VTSRLPILLAAAAALLVPRAEASTADAEARLQSAVGKVLAVAEKSSTPEKLAGDLRPILLDYISFDAMTRRAIGPGWRQFTPEQQKRAVQLFTTLIIRTYSDKFTPGEHPVVKYKAPVTPAPGRVEVPTSLLYNGSSYEVTYRLELENGWQITDVLLEGVSLIANYRSQFDAQFKKDGAKAVLAALAQAENK